jgi:hypothetical protein
MMGPFADVRALAGRLLSRDRFQGRRHDRRRLYARTGLTAAAGSRRSVSPNSERGGGCG